MGVTALRVAAFQRQPLFDDVPGTLRRVEADLGWCTERGVHLALFPECYLQGYATDRETIKRRALALDSAATDDLRAISASRSTTVIVGLIEQRGPSFLNTALVIQAGRMLGTYSKGNTYESGFHPGTDYPIFITHGWSFGINICNDSNFPGTALRISRQGARLLCYPLNNMLLLKNAAKWRSKTIETLRARALDTGCWVASSDVVGQVGSQMSYGCTCIIRPDGEIMARAPEETEAVALFDLG